jgi:hypothetical protein
MSLSAFNTVNVNYNLIADNGFGNTVNYDLGFLSSIFQVSIRIKLVGDNAGSVVTIWENGIETIWNDKAFFPMAPGFTRSSSMWTSLAAARTKQ